MATRAIIPYNYKQTPVIFVREHTLCGKVQKIPYARYNDGTEVILYAFFEDNFKISADKDNEPTGTSHTAFREKIRKLSEPIYVYGAHYDATYDPTAYGAIKVRNGCYLRNILPSCTLQVLNMYKTHVRKCNYCKNKLGDEIDSEEERESASDCEEVPSPSGIFTAMRPDIDMHDAPHTSRFKRRHFETLSWASAPAKHRRFNGYESDDGFVVSDDEDN